MKGKKTRKIRKQLSLFLLSLAIIYLIGLAGVTIFSRDTVQTIAEVPNQEGKVPGGQTTDAPADWRLILANSENPIPKGYTIETRSLPNGLTFDARAYDSLMSMLEDGKKAGLSFVVCSAYRTVDKQTSLFEAQVAKQRERGLSDNKAYEVAKTIVAFPGTSEHNLGLAADIVALDYQVLDQGYADTPEAKWLKENSYQYGFVLRYPANKEKITKIIYEPWHFRYVGPEHALEMKRLGLCLEEYIEHLQGSAARV